MTDTRKAQLEIGVNAGPAEEGFKRVERAGKGMADAVGKSAESAGKAVGGIGDGADTGAKKLDRATNSIIASVQRTTAAMQAGEKGTAKYFETLASQRGVNADVLKPYLDQLRAIEIAQGNVGVSAKQTAAAMRGVPAQFTDIITSLQGGQAPMTVLLQQGGQLKDMFGGIGNAAKALGGYVVGLINPFTVAAAAGGVLALAYAQGSKEADEFRKSLLLSGNAAGASVGQLSALAESIGAGFGKNVGQAAAALATLAASGGVGRASLKDFATTAVEAEKAFGIAAKDIAKNFADLAKDPLGATVKLNESMNYLTESTYKQIKAAQDLGQDAKAAALAQDAYNSALKGRSAEMLQNAGTIEKAWAGIKSAATGAWDAMLGIGRPVTIASQIGLAQKNLEAAVDKRKTVGDDTAFAPALDKEIAKLKEQLGYVTELDRITKRAGDSAAESARQTKARVEADKEGLKYLTEQERMQRDIAQQTATLRQAKASDAEIEQRIAQIKASYAKKDAGGAGGQSELDGLRTKIKLNADYLDALQDGEGRAAKATEAERTLAKIKQELVGSLSDQARANKLAAQTLAEKAVQQEREIAAEELGLKIIKESAEERRKLFEDQSKNTGKLQAEVEKQREQNAAIGLTAEAMGQLTSRRYDDAAAAAEQKAQTYALIDPQIAAELNNQAKLYRELADLKRAGGVKQAGVDAEKSAVDAAKKAISEYDALVGRIDTAKLNGLFGGAIDGALQFATALNTVAEVATKTQAALEANAKVNAGDGAKRASEEARILAQSATAQISAYGSMAAGLKSYAKEGSQAYNALYTAEKVFRAFELASALTNMATKSGLLATFVGTKVAGDAAMTASGAAAAATDIATTAAVGQAKAIAGVANQSGGDPYSAFPRMAAMAAIMAGLGFIVGGIGSGGGGAAPTNSGTGTVFGDKDAQSKSLKNSLDILNKTQDIALKYSKAMADSLRTIESSIGSFTNVYLRTGGTSGLTDTIATGKFDTGLSSAMKFGKELLGPIGGAFGNIVTSLFGKSVKIQGSGISAANQTLGGVLGSGFEGNTFADVQSKSKFFGITYSTSNSTRLGQLDPILERQITSIFKGVSSAVGTAAEALGQDTSAIQKRLQEYVVSIGRVDLQGLNGEQIAEKLGAVFGAESDKIAASVIPGFERLQKVGEGYFETLTRVANQFEVVNVYMARLGDTLGQTGLNAASAADDLTQLFGGLDQFQSAISDYYKAFYTEAERTAQTTKELQAAFGGLGQSMPASMQGFRDLVNAQNLTTESGRATYAALIKLSPAFAEVSKAMEAAAAAAAAASAAAAQAAADAATAAIQKITDNISAIKSESAKLLDQQIGMSQSAASAARAAASAFESAGQGLRDAANAILMRIGDVSRNTRTAYTQGLALAQTGSADALRTLPALATAMLTEQRTRAATGAEAAIFAARTAAELTNAAKVAGTAAAGKSYEASVLDVNTATLQVMRDQLQVGTATSDSLRQQLAALKAIETMLGTGGDAQTLAIKQVNSSVTGTGEAQALALRLLNKTTDSGVQLQNSALGIGEVAAVASVGSQSLLDAVLAQLKVPDASANLLNSTFISGNSAIVLKIESLIGAVQNQTAAQQSEAARVRSLAAASDQLKGLATGAQKSEIDAAVSASASSVLKARVNMYAANEYYQAVNGGMLASGILAGAQAALKMALERESSVKAQKATYDDQMQALRQTIISLGGIPAFASGGMHRGGIRLVGEHGPELEVTGASTILSASTTAAILSGSGQGSQMAELRALREELAALRAETRSSAVSNAKTARILDRVTQGTDSLMTQQVTP